MLDLAAALARAKTAVEAIPVEEMKGACNRDTAEVVLKGWRRAGVEAAATIAACNVASGAEAVGTSMDGISGRVTIGR